MKPADTADTESRSHFRTIKTLLPYLWPSTRTDLKTRVVAALSFLVVAKLVNVTVPFLLKGAVDGLSEKAGIITLPLALILGYSAARIGAQLFGELRDFLFAKVSQHAQRVVGLNTFKHLHSLSLAFHLDRQTGGLSRVIERGMHGIQFLLSFMLFNILPTILEIILVTGILFYKFNLSFSIVTFSTILVYIAYTLAITNWRVHFRRTMNQKDSEANTKAVDSLLNYETVKYFGNEEHEYKRFDHSLSGYESAAILSQAGLSILNVGQGIIIGIGLALVMVLAGKGVVDGSMTAGDFVMVNTFLIQLYLPLNFLGFVYRESKQSLVDMDKMFELLDIHTEIKDAPGAKPLDAKKGEIEFKNVSFGYNPDRVILKNVSFTVPAGKKVAIVGPSGAGKSTVSRLLFRFYEANSGSICIDGQNINSVTQKSLRQSIGIVPQDTVLFNDTIGYNIRYGNPNAPESQVTEAAQHAEIHDFIMSLTQQYGTMVGERGLKLSGGEKQRVAIARTILKNPTILLFDEATSALDTHTEKEIQDSLREISADKTTLVIAHRLSTIIDADEILVLVKGEIAERGRHSELLKKGGEYASMWKKQLEVRNYEEKLESALAKDKG